MAYEFINAFTNAVHEEWRDHCRKYKLNSDMYLRAFKDPVDRETYWKRAIHHERLKEHCEQILFKYLVTVLQGASKFKSQRAHAAKILYEMNEPVYSKVINYDGTNIRKGTSRTPTAL